MIGDHTVTLLPLGSAPVDITCLVDQVAIRHGRDDPDSQPEPSSATLDLSPAADVDTMPGLLEIGAGIRVDTTTITATYTRFVGRVTDLSYGWEDAGEATPDRPQGQVIAVGPMADLGRRIVGDAPWAQELDGARVANVLAAAGVVLDPAYSDPGTVQILPRDVDSQPALEVAKGTAESANGLVWETRAGEIRYADADHRRGIAVALALDACDVLVTPTWKRSTEALLNRVSLGYGPVPEEGEQARYVADRPESVARYGRYELTTETELATEADATALGDLLLTRNSSPVWIMSELPVDMKGLDAGQTDALLGMDMHALVSLTGLPSAGAAPTTAQLWLEGWTETLAWGTHEITLAVSGYCRTVPAPRWNDVDPGWTWGGTTQAPVTLVHTNLMRGPRSTASGWWTKSGAGVTLADIAGGGFTITTDGTVTNQGVYVDPAKMDDDTGPWLVGDQYSTRVRWKASVPGAYEIYGGNLINGGTGSGAYIATVTLTAATVDVWQETVINGITVTNPPANSGPYPIIRVKGAAPLATVITVDSVLMVKAATAPPYFDGDTPDPVGGQYDWTGTPGASTSTYSTNGITARNRVNNPDVETSITGWNTNQASQFVVTRDTVNPITGTASAMCTRQAAMPSANVMSCYISGVGAGATVATSAAAVPGETLLMAMDMRTEFAGRYVTGFIRFKNAANVLVQDSPTVRIDVPTPGTVRLAVQHVAPAGAACAYLTITAFTQSGALAIEGERLWMDRLYMGPPITPDYFDGDTPDTPSTNYEWTGNPHASPSIATAITDIPNGLPPELTWDGATCLGPPLQLGRWDDTPASTRWDLVPPATTWDTWKVGT